MNQTNFLVVLYLDHLPRVLTENIAKVVVLPCEIVIGDPIELIINPDVIRFSGVFNFAAYNESDKETKKRMALEFLHSSLMEVARIKKWDSRPFLVAYSKVLEKNIINERPWGKPVVGPKRIKAQPWCLYDSDKASIYVAFFKGSTFLGKVWVTDVKPGNVWINEVIGKLTWESEKDLKLITRDGSASWSLMWQPMDK